MHYYYLLLCTSSTYRCLFLRTVWIIKCDFFSAHVAVSNGSSCWRSAAINGRTYLHISSGVRSSVDQSTGLSDAVAGTARVSVAYQWRSPSPSSECAEYRMDWHLDGRKSMHLQFGANRRNTHLQIGICHQGSISQTAMTQPHFFPHSSVPLLPVPLLNRGPGYQPRENFWIRPKDACRRVLEHFRHKHQHI